LKPSWFEVDGGIGWRMELGLELTGKTSFETNFENEIVNGNFLTIVLHSSMKDFFYAHHQNSFT